MRELIRKNLIILLLAALAAFLTFFWLVLRQRPPEETGPTPVPSGEVVLPSSKSLLSSQGNISLALGPEIAATFPKSLPVFPIITFTEDGSLAFAAPLVSALGFRSQPKVVSWPTGVFWQWSERENSLSINQKTGRLHFSGNVKVAGPITESNFEQVAKNLFSSWGLFSGKSEAVVTGFIRAGNDLEPVRSLSQAEVFRVQLAPRLSDFPVVGAGTTDPVIEIKITREGELRSLTFNLSRTSAAQGFPTQSFSRAVEELTNGNAQVLWVQDSSGNSFYPTGGDRLVSSTITATEIVFVELPEEQTALLPFFLFSGNGKTAAGMSVSVFFVVPAI